MNYCYFQTIQISETRFLWLCFLGFPCVLEFIPDTWCTIHIVSFTSNTKIKIFLLKPKLQLNVVQLNDSSCKFSEFISNGALNMVTEHPWDCLIYKNSLALAVIYMFIFLCLVNSCLDSTKYFWTNKPMSLPWWIWCFSFNLCGWFSSLIENL